MKILKTFSLTCFLVLTIFATQSYAQDATVQATGTVLEPLSVTGTNLNFGTEIFPGINEVVERTDAEAAQFDIAGENDKEITATFTLPTELEDGENSLPITFSTTDGGYNDSEDQAGATEFDPNSEHTNSLSATGTFFIWLGGTVEPAEDQAAGSYSANITLDTVYTGN